MGKPRGGGKKPCLGFKPPQKPVNQGTNKSQSRAATTDNDTAGTNSESDRRRKVATPRLPGVDNRFFIHETPLSDYSESVSEVSSIHVRRPVPHNAKKMPPLVISTEHKEVALTVLAECVQSKMYTLRNMQVGIRVDIPNETEHNTFVNRLKEAKGNFYSYHSPHTKPKRFVLYGLEDMQIESLRTTLSELQIAPTDVKKLNIKKPRYDKQAVYLLYYAPGTMTLSELRKIKAIKHVVIKWDHYRPRQQDNVAQCRNCQRLGHSSINCFMPAKCLVCAEQHKTDSCPKRIPKMDLRRQVDGASAPVDKSYVKCANCGQNHTASYRGCQKRKDFLEAQAIVVRKRHSQFSRGPKLNLHDSIAFPQLGQENKHVPMAATTSQEQSWADVLNGFKQEQGSVTTLIGSLQATVEAMKLMMVKMTQFMEAMTSQILNAGMNKMD